MRAAAVHVLRYSGHRVDGQAELLAAAAGDAHGRVRLEAVAAASWLTPAEAGLAVLEVAARREADDWIRPVYEAAEATLRGEAVEVGGWDVPETELVGEARALYVEGAAVYRREGHCITCHQDDGRGLPAAQFPPLAGTRWVLGDEARLIKLTLHGLLGPIEVKGEAYPGLVPMTAFKSLSDREVAAVLTYVRNSFGNRAAPVLPERVTAVRAATAGREGFWSPAELLELHPFGGD